MADNLVLGRGKVFFAPYAKDTTTGGTKGYFGNTPTMSLAQTNTKLDHFSSEGGLKIKDRSVTLQTDMTITFDTDNISLGNLTLWFGGSSSASEPTDAPTDLGPVAIIGKTNAIFGALFFEADNPVGENFNYWFPYVSISPTGTYALKGDTWQQMSFTAECLKRDPATERMYVYAPVGGVSTAASDTTPELTPAMVEVAGDNVATGGTISVVGTTEAAGVAFDATYTLTGGTVAWAFVNDGTVDLTTRMTATGASGTVSMTAPSAGSVTVDLFDNYAGTGTALAQSATLTVS